ncbi:MAG: hypothetical protein WCH46_06755 [bacterium]
MKKSILSLIIGAFIFICVMLTTEACKHTLSHPLAAATDTTTGGGNGGGGIDTALQTPIHVCSPDSVYFANDILPLIENHCDLPDHGCHDAKASKAQPLTNYAQLLNDENVVPNSPLTSKVLTTRTRKGEDKMPQPPGIVPTPHEDSLIRKWILQGAKDNYCDGDCSNSNVTFEGSVLPIIKYNCTGCHSGSNPAGKISLTNYDEIAAQAANKKLLATITYSKGYIAMPPYSKLSICDANTLKIWVRNGYPK